MGIYLLGAAALAAAHGAKPGVARAEDAKRIYMITELGEICIGSCSKGYLCCTVVVAPPA
jgi:hypothetical protein